MADIAANLQADGVAEALLLCREISRRRLGRCAWLGFLRGGRRLALSRLGFDLGLKAGQSRLTFGSFCLESLIFLLQGIEFSRVGGGGGFSAANQQGHCCNEYGNFCFCQFFHGSI